MRRSFHVLLAFSLAALAPGACAHIAEAPLSEAAPAKAAPGGGDDRLAGVTYGWSLAGKAAESGQCKEEWRFGADGVLTVVSGKEIVTKSYRLAPVAGDPMMSLRTTRLTTNGLPDCLGATTLEVGQEREILLQFLNDGSFFTCGSTDGLSCYGVASRRTPKSP